MRIMLAALLSLIPILTRADATSEELLDRMRQTISSYASYEVRFTASGGLFSDIAGRCIVSGNKYYFNLDGQEIFFDGNTTYTYSEENDEVILEAPDSDNHINPTQMFAFYEGYYDHSTDGERVVGGKNLVRIRLVPKGGDNDFDCITLEVDRRTALPVNLLFSGMELTIDSFTPNIPVSAATFTFDPVQHPGVEVIDFR